MKKATDFHVRQPQKRNKINNQIKTNQKKKVAKDTLLAYLNNISLDETN